MALETLAREAAEEVLRFLCVGRRITGIHFAGDPVLLLDYPGRGVPQLRGFLRVEFGWVVAERGPVAWPGDGVWLPERPVEELAAAAVRLRRATIRAARLGRTAAHLAFEFEGGAILMLSGSHPERESWELNAGGYTVKALPGGGVWSHGFRAEPDATANGGRDPGSS